MAKKENSLFKVRASTVPDVSAILPEKGAIVLNEVDGFLYFADAEGWKQLTGTAI